MAGGATAAEAVVREGDELEIEGPLVEVAAPSGYRGSRTQLAALADRSLPVRIRKPGGA